MYKKVTNSKFQIVIYFFKGAQALEFWASIFYAKWSNLGTG